MSPQQLKVKAGRRLVQKKCADVQISDVQIFLLPAFLIICISAHLKFVHSAFEAYGFIPVLVSLGSRLM